MAARRFLRSCAATSRKRVFDMRWTRIGVRAGIPNIGGTGMIPKDGCAFAGGEMEQKAGEPFDFGIVKYWLESILLFPIRFPNHARESIRQHPQNWFERYGNTAAAVVL
jgi:hypothetical protein